MRSAPRRELRRGPRGPASVVASLAALLWGAPLLLGGVFGWAATTIAIAAVLAAAIALFIARGRRVALVFPPVVYLIAAILSVISLQSLPMPASVMAHLQPAAVQAAERLEWIDVEANPWVAFSLDPGATRASLVHAAAALAAALAAAIALHLVSRRLVISIAALSSVVLAVVALAHEIVDAREVFGFYRARFASPPILSPLLNPNHLAALVGMAPPALVGLGLDESRPGVRAAWVGAAILCFVTTLMTLSRGGIAACLGGLVLLAAFSLLRRRRRAGGSLRGVALTFAMMSTAVMLALYAAADAVLAQFVTDDYAKLEVIARASELVALHPWLGVGRGAFSAAFVPLMGVDARYEYAECSPIQLAADLGVPIAVLSGGWTCREWIRGVTDAASWSRLGACAALASLALHDLVDFALELPAVAVVAAVYLVAATARRVDLTATRGGDARVLRSTLTPLGALLVTGAIAVVIGPTIDARSVRETADRMVEAIREERWGRFDEDLRRGLADHPTEPTFALLAAHGAVVRGMATAPRWLNHVMTLAPHWPQPHVLAAEWLLLRGADTQAALEIREAEDRRPGAARTLVCRLIRESRTDPERLLSAAPAQPLRDAFLDRAAQCVPYDDPVAIALDAALQDSTLSAPRIRIARRAREAGRLEEARAALEGAQRPLDPAIADLLAATLVDQQELEEADAVVRSAIAELGPQPALLARLARVQAAGGDVESARDTVTRLRGRAAGDPRRLGEAFRLLGEIELDAGNQARALGAFEDAYQVAPDPASLTRISAVAEQLGDLRRAYGAATRLCQTRATQQDCATAERLRTRLREPPAQVRQLTVTP